MSLWTSWKCFFTELRISNSTACAVFGHWAVGTFVSTVPRILAPLLERCSCRSTSLSCESRLISIRCQGGPLPNHIFHSLYVALIELLVRNTRLPKKNTRVIYVMCLALDLNKLSSYRYRPLGLCGIESGAFAALIQRNRMNMVPSVAKLVVFRRGRPIQSHYRRYWGDAARIRQGFARFSVLN